MPAAEMALPRPKRSIIIADGRRQERDEEGLELGIDGERRGHDVAVSILLER